MELNKPSTSKANANKQKICRNLTLQQELEAVKKKDAYGLTSKITVEYNINYIAVRRWIRNKKKLKKYSISSKRVRLSPVQKVNMALTTWYKNRKKKNKTITMKQVKAKALELIKQFDDTGLFKASDEWLRTWKQRNGIHFMTNSEDQLSANTKTINKFKNKILELVETEQLTLHQIFNFNITRLYFKMMPNGSLEHSASSCKKDSLTVMACCNTSGSLKMPLLVIGKHKSSKPLTNCPVSYKFQKNAWMTNTIFEKWFKGQFVPRVCNFLRSKSLPEKAILLVGNARTRSSKTILSVDGIKAISFPPNVTSIIQPLVIEAVKRRYKTELLAFVINAQANGMKYNEAINSLDIKNAMDLIGNAWNDITEQTISNCCKELLNMPLEQDNSLDSITSKYIHQMCKKIPCHKNITIDQINEWIYADCLPSLTDGEIIEINEKPYKDESDYYTEEDHLKEKEVSPAKALDSLDCVIKFFTKTGKISLFEMRILKKTRKKLLKIKNNI